MKQLIPAIGHDRRWGDLITLFGLVIFAFRPLLPAFVLGVAGAALLAACIRTLPGDERFSRPARAMVGALCFHVAVAGPWREWPTYMLIPIAGALGLAWAAGFGRDFLAGLERGRLHRTEWGLIGLIAIVAAIALVAWVTLFQPDLTRLRSLIPEWPLLGLIGAGATFSIVNAILEEIVWRGILQRWLMTFMAPPVAVAVQAASFGAAHYAGFPSGAVGIILAAFWGAMIGGLALRSKGLLAPIVAHVAADAVIFAVLAGALEYG